MNFSASPGGIEDQNKPKVVADLAPLPPERAAYAQEAIIAFYADGISAIQARTHPSVAKEFDGLKAKALEKLASNSARLGEMTYSGHGFGQERGFDYTAIQYNIPSNKGHDEVRIVVSNKGECCQIIGFHIDAKFQKSFKFGGD